MAITYGFYNSMNGDRKYDAVQLSSIFDGVIRDGVFQSIGGYLATKPGTGMQVIVSPGKAWFDHTWTVNDADLPLDISPSDLTLSRYDAVVLETDATKSVRENSIKVIKGTPASDPKKPTLTNEGDVHQHPLAYILVPGGSTEIQVQNIDIMVGKTECPFVTSILESVSIEALLEKWEGEFRVWFDELQNQMSGDVATNLQNQITRNAPSVGDIVVSYNSNKAGPWLLCSGEKYDIEKYSELYEFRQKALALNSGFGKVPLTMEAIMFGDKALYLMENSFKIGSGMSTARLIMCRSSSNGITPDYDAEMDLYKMGVPSNKTLDDMCFAYINSTYVIMLLDSNGNIQVLYSKNFTDWTWRAIATADNYSFAKICGVFYFGGNYWVAGICGGDMFLRAIDLENDTTYKIMNVHDGKSISIPVGGDGICKLLKDGEHIAFIPNKVSSSYGRKFNTSTLTYENIQFPYDQNLVSSRLFEISGVLYKVGLAINSNTVYLYKEGSSSQNSTDALVAGDYYSGALPASYTNFLDIIEDGDDVYVLYKNLIIKVESDKLNLMDTRLQYPVGAMYGEFMERSYQAHFLTGSIREKKLLASSHLTNSPPSVPPYYSGCYINYPEMTPYVETEHGYAYIRSEK